MRCVLLLVVMILCVLVYVCDPQLWLCRLTVGMQKFKGFYDVETNVDTIRMMPHEQLDSLQANLLHHWAYHANWP